MLKNYILITVRNLKKYKIYSFINILGLTIGMTCAILISLLIQFELSYDRYHEKADRIVRLVTPEHGYTPAPMGPAMVENLLFTVIASLPI